MNYISVCSGIEAATMAWHPLGWNPLAFSEVDKSASRVLAHHYPNVPNLGDMTKFREWPDYAADLLVGGTPCQSFSVAGLRKGMADPRGNLALTYLAIADRYKPYWIVWENVPGVLSSNGGRDFGAFLAGLGQCGYGWAYRVLDAQFVRVDGFGRAVPQRRRRVFVVGCLGGWQRAAAVLFERESLCWHSAPRRETREGIARGFETGPSGGCLTDLAPTMDARAKDGPIRNQLGVGVISTVDVSQSLRAQPNSAHDATHESYVGIVQGVSPTICESGGHARPGDNLQSVETLIPCVDVKVFGGGDTRGSIDVAATLNANRGCHSPGDFEAGNLLAVGTVAHSLKASHDSGDDGTGRGTPLIPIAIQGADTRENPSSGPDGVGVRTDGAAYTLEARQEVQAVAYRTTGNNGAFETGDIVNALNTATDRNQHVICEPMVLMERGREGGGNLEYRQDGTANAILTPNGGRGGFGVGAIAQQFAVRRLTPRECERLQGFPDDYTLLQGSEKHQADGPRYKQLGNSMAVNVMRWIGTRIQMVEDALKAERDAA